MLGCPDIGYRAQKTITEAMLQPVVNLTNYNNAIIINALNVEWCIINNRTDHLE